MAKNVCYVCAKEYDACPNCEDSHINPWRKTVCSREHFQIRDVYFQYRDGSISAAQAKEMLERIGITDGDNLKQGYQNFINEVMGTSKKTKGKNK